MRKIALAAVIVVAAVCLAAGCRLFNRAAQSAATDKLLELGQRAADAEEMHLHHAPGGEPRFAGRLEDLLPFDPTLADDPAVVFDFGPADDANYSITITRAGSPGKAVCDAETGCRVEMK